jgi:hypothetical protein
MSDTASASQLLEAPATFPAYEKFGGPGLLEPFAWEGQELTRASVARQYSFMRRESVFSVTSGAYDIYSHPDGRTITIYYIIPEGQKYWWSLDKPSRTGNTVDELAQLLKSIF